MARPRREIPWLQIRDGVYYVFWYDAGAGRTQRASLRTSDRVEAQHRYAAFLSEGHAIFDSRGNAVLRVDYALDQYWHEHVQKNVVDKERAEDAIAHLKTYFGSRPMQDIDIPSSRAYADARRMGAVGGGARRRNKEGSDSTIRRELVVLQAAANHAAKWKRLGPNATPPTPMPSIELPKEARAEEAPWLTKEDLQRLFAAATGRTRDFLMICYYTGARRASIETLTKFQVDLRQNRINLRGPAEDVNRRRSKKRRPIVPIDSAIRPVVERLMADGGSGLLFGDARSMYRPVKELLAELDLPGSPHVLRHSRASHLLQSGVPIYDVARLLGDTVATVERVYGHHSAEYMAEAVNRGALTGA